MHVVATAGHVDHGKSTLVRALTGSDPDRLEEERRRGLSIELGYCWTELVAPDGRSLGDVAFVDVPGHSRFVSTALAGVGPVPVAMLVVAADDPWMPQAAEHLAALDALGVRHGVLVVTRSDLADPAPAVARAREELAHTGLRDAPAVTVSGRTGAGLDDLRAALAGVLESVPQPDPEAAVRLWIDRRFTVHGTGTVVTGTLPAGTIRVGDTLCVGDEPVRVRGLESLGRPVESVRGVARVAVDLGGRAPEAISRGTVLVSPDAFEAVTTLDVRLTGDLTQRLPERPVLHVGAAMTTVRARPLGDRHARLALEHPLPLRLGDRALLRDPGSRTVWGVRVLDPAPPPLGRRGSARTRAAALASYDGALAGQLAARGLVRADLLRRIGVPTEPLPAGSVRAGDWLLSPERAARLRADLVAAVDRLATPLQPGVTPAALAHELDLPDAALVPPLVAPPLRIEEARVRRDRAPGLPPALARAVEGLAADLRDAPFAAPDAGRLAQLGLDPKTVAALHRTGHVLRVAEGVVLLPGADEEARDVLRGLPQPFTTSQARQALGTSRRVALPLLAHLDRTGRTLRLPDDRRQVRG
ncbi:SelB C-terminal domain-containing protein [Nocardioides panaciterrulae]|uniref:Selenocysteine-specific elongation factor n=1 Tax=Nocardioides panaciterrulae TaxID=661492 RepID=A0A7Y9E4W5_9ACTN|nr:selenocysteine-specific elongation factor [Nocardioides panaciterrulae]